MRNTLANQSVSKHVLSGSRIVDRIAKHFFIKTIGNIRAGTIIVRDGKEEIKFGAVSGACGLTAVLTVTDRRFYRSIMLGGSIGAAEAYIAGYWKSDDMTTLIRIIIQNREVLVGMDKGFSSLVNALHYAVHRKRINSLIGSARNIHAHYDLGNEFFRSFLDDTMTYSCGIFRDENSSLGEASVLKYDHICRKLSLTRADHVIEIGTGWGGFAIHAAGTYGCRVTTATISKAQYDLAKERIEQAGLRDRITVLLRDYREIPGRYSKLVSIEMIEAVGHEFLATFFACCSRLLTDEGVMALQAITISDQVYDEHIKSVDFIRRYIFPGGSITSVTGLCAAATAGSDLRLIHLEDITPHYQQTLICWREKFTTHLGDIRTFGYTEQFIRMWAYYFCYCEAGFAERYIGDVQLLYAKPGWRGHTLFTLSHE